MHGEDKDSISQSPMQRPRWGETWTLSSPSVLTLSPLPSARQTTTLRAALH